MKNTIHITLALLLLCNFSCAQDTTKIAASSSPLEQLKGFTQTYYYSPGHEARAKSIAVFMERAGNYFQREIRFTPKQNFTYLHSNIGKMWPPNHYTMSMDSRITLTMFVWS